MKNKLRKIIDGKAPSAVKASFAFTICNVFQKGLSIIAVPVFTRLLTTKEYGIYSLFTSWFWLLIIFTSLNMYEDSLNNAFIKFTEDRDGYTSSVFFLSCIITCIFFGIYVLFRSFLEPFIGLNFTYVILLFIQLLFMPAVYFWTNRNKFDYKFNVVVPVTIAMSFLAIVLSIVAAIFVPEQFRLLARIGVMVLVQVMFCVVIMIVIFQKGRVLVNFEYWKYALMFNIPLIPYYLSVTILNQSDRLMINYYIGESETAFYSLAYSIGMLTTLVTNGINSSLIPWIYKKMDLKAYSDVNKRLVQLSFFVGGMTLTFIFIAPELIRLFANDAYYEAIYVIPPIALSVYFIFVAQLIANIEFFYEKKLFVMISSIACAVINILLNYLFIRVYGYYAAGYTTLVCYIGLAAINFMFYKQIEKTELCRSSVINLKWLSMISVVVTFCGINVQLLYDYYLVRYVILITLILFLTMIICRIMKKGKNSD